MTMANTDLKRLVQQPEHPKEVLTRTTWATLPRSPAYVPCFQSALTHLRKVLDSSGSMLTAKLRSDLFKLPSFDPGELEQVFRHFRFGLGQTEQPAEHFDRSQLSREVWIAFMQDILLHFSRHSQRLIEKAVTKETRTKFKMLVSVKRKTQL